MQLPPSIDAVQELLAGQGYVCGRPLATVVFLSLTLGRPLFLEERQASARQRSPKHWRWPWTAS